MRPFYLALLVFCAFMGASPATQAMPIAFAQPGRLAQLAFDVGADLYARCYLISQPMADASHRTYEGLAGGCR